MRSPEQFANVVHQMADIVEVVLLGAQGPGAFPLLIWPEMADAQWRDAALRAIDDRRVMDAQFCEPNELNDWMFKARRRVAS